MCGYSSAELYYLLCSLVTSFALAQLCSALRHFFGHKSANNVLAIVTYNSYKNSHTAVRITSYLVS